MLCNEDGQQSERNSAAIQEQSRGSEAAYKKRLSLTDMDTEHSNKYAPTIASPAAYGFGPSVALPTLLGMMPQVTDLDDETDDDDEDTDGDVLMKYMKGLTPKVRGVIGFIYLLALLPLFVCFNYLIN